MTFAAHSEVPGFFRDSRHLAIHVDSVDVLNEYRWRLTIDRRGAGVRQAVWYSAIGALRYGKVVQFDRDALRSEPE